MSTSQQHPSQVQEHKQPGDVGGHEKASSAWSKQDVRAQGAQQGQQGAYAGEPRTSQGQPQTTTQQQQPQPQSHVKIKDVTGGDESASAKSSQSPIKADDIRIEPLEREISGYLKEGTGEPDTVDARATIVSTDARQRLAHDTDDASKPIGAEHVDYTKVEDSEGYKERLKSHARQA